MTQSIFFDVIARDRASQTFNRIGGASSKTQSRLLGLSKSAIGAAGGLYAITRAAGGFLRVGGEYVGSLNKIQALTDANDTRMKRAAGTLESQASNYAQMGMTVGDAANGVVELTKAGMGLGKSLKSVNAIMILAKAGSMAVADSAALVSNALNVWRGDNLKAGDAANVLANAANISSADVSDLAQSLQMASNVAASAGASFQETNAMLAMLANAGMKGSDAGTSLKTMLLSLQAPSSTAAKGLKAVGVNAFDASGKARPLRDVLADLDGKFKGLSDQDRAKRLKQIFGSDAYRAAKVIFGQHVDQFDDYVRKVNKAGAAQKLAQSASKGFTGTLAALQAETISTAQAAYRELSPKLDEAAQKLLEFVQQMRSGEGAGGDFVDLLKDLVAIGKSAVQILNAIPGPVKKFAVEGLIAYAMLRKMTAATSGWSAALAPTIARTKQFAAEMTYAETRAQRLGSATRTLGSGVKQLAGVGGMILLADSMRETDSSAKTLKATLGGAAAGFMVGGPIGGAIGALGGLTMSLAGHTETAADKWHKARREAYQFGQTLDGVTAAITRETHAQVLQALTSQTNAIPAAKALGLSQRDVIKYVEGSEKAQRKVNQAMKIGAKAGVMLTLANGGQVRASDALNQSLNGYKDKAKGITQTFGEQRKEAERNAAKMRQLKAALDGLPKKVVTKLTDDKTADISRRRVMELAEEYRKTPKEVRTLLKLAGYDTANRQLSAIEQRLQRLASKIYTASVQIIPFAGGGGGGGGGRGRGGGGRGSSSERLMESAGRTAGESYASGLESSRMKVSKALAKYTDMASKAADKLANLRDTRAGFAGTFAADSIFGADMSAGGGIGSLIAMQQQQAAQATQLLADIRSLTGRGLSKSLISQLQAQGTSGAAALRAIAMGDQSQIAQLNALNAQTQASLGAAGMAAGNFVRGGNIDADIARANRDAALIEQIVKRLRKVDDDKYVVIEWNGDVLVKAARKDRRRRGSSAGLD